MKIRELKVIYNVKYLKKNSYKIYIKKISNLKNKMNS